MREIPWPILAPGSWRTVMMLRISTLDQFNSPRTYLLVAYIVILIIGFIAFMVKAHKAEAKATKRIFEGFGLFGLTYAITRLIFLFSDYENATHQGTNTYLLFDWVTAAYTVTFAALILIYHTVERLMLNRKPVFTVIAIISFVICMVALVLTVLTIGVNLDTGTGPQTISQYTLYVTGPILIIGIAALYIMIARNASGNVRKKAIGALVGLLVLSAGLLFDMDGLWKFFTSFDDIRLLLSPTCFIAGTITFFLAQK